MSRQVVLAVALFLCYAVSCAFAGCDSTVVENTCEGNFLYEASGDLNGIVKINGNLNFASSIQNINDVNDLVSIGGNLNLANLNNLESVSSFSSLTTVSNNIIISNNNALITVSGFDKLATVNDLVFTNNYVLTSIPSFNKLTGIRNLNIYSNNVLKKIDGFNALVSANEALFYADYKLESITGFKSLLTVHHLSIGSPRTRGANYVNEELSTIDGFNSLINSTSILSIYDNPELEDINFLSNLENALNLIITDNNKVASFCPLRNLKSVSYLSLDSDGADCVPEAIPVTLNCTCPSPSPKPSGASTLRWFPSYFMKDLLY